MKLGTELQLRANISEFRQQSTNAALRAQGKRDEEALFNDTHGLDEHPVRDDGELYDGPCVCNECKSYGA